MKKILAILLFLLPTLLMAQTVNPYFGKNEKGTAKAVQKEFKKSFKRPKGVNYDTSAKINVTCAISADGHLVITDPELVTVLATTYNTVVETENYNYIHSGSNGSDSHGVHREVMGGGAKREGKTESELLREAVLEWLPTMPLWTPGTVDGQPQQLEVSFELTF